MNQNKLTVHAVDDLTAALSKNIAFPPFEISDCTLPALLEFACQRWIWKMERGIDILIHFPKLKSSLQWALLKKTNTAISCLESSEPSSQLETRGYNNKMEIYPLPKGKEWLELPWQLFQQRFDKTMRENGFPEKLSKAITGAMAEMSDNVEQHAESKIRGLVGYEVEFSHVTYSVVDLGVGILASLKQNPQFVHLDFASEAISLALKPGVSKIPNSSRGTGFQTVINSLADLNGVLRFRSDDGCVTIDGRSPDLRKAKLSTVPFRRGFQLAVYCSLPR